MSGAFKAGKLLSQTTTSNNYMSKAAFK